MTKDKNVLTLRALTKGNVWDLQENDIFTMWAKPEKDDAISEHGRHYMDIIKTAFEVEEIKVNKPEVIKKYEDRGCKVGQIKYADCNTKWAIKKKPILRVTDLSYENINHITAAKLIEVLERNFGGGWESLSQSIRDIIESGFDISTTTLPANRLKKPGGMYEKKVADGFEVLEIPKGLWVEAIFAKEKPEQDKPRSVFMSNGEEDDVDTNEEDEEMDIEDTYSSNDDDDDDFDEDKLTEESYRTTFDTDPEDLELADEEVSEEEIY